jgi:hypothetical protein
MNPPPTKKFQVEQQFDVFGEEFWGMKTHQSFHVIGEEVWV